MRHRSEPHSFEELLNAEKARIEAALESIRPGPERDLLDRNLRQIETALHIDGWLSSTELQPPKLTRG
jgi:hypothetical protein